MVNIIMPDEQAALPGAPPGRSGDPLSDSGIGNQLGFLLRQAEAAVWQDLVATLAPFDLRPAQYAALRILRASPGCKQQEIGDALGIQRPNMVRLIEGLRARKLLTASRNPTDRRSYALRLTAAGRALLTRVDRAHDGHEARLAATLGDSDAAALAGTLRRLGRLGTTDTAAG